MDVTTKFYTPDNIKNDQGENVSLNSDKEIPWESIELVAN